MEQGTAKDHSGARGQLRSGLDQPRRLGAAAFVSACRLAGRKLSPDRLDTSTTWGK
jgi:hypothetical protein